MLRNLTLYILPVLAGFVYIITSSYSTENGFKHRLLEYIENNSLAEESSLTITDPEDNYFPSLDNEHFTFRKGDWEEYIVSPKYKNIDKLKEKTLLYRGSDVEIYSYGSLKLDLLYGKSIFTKKSYQLYDEDKPESLVIPSGFKVTNDIQVHMEGMIGDRMKIFIDHDSKKEDNHYMFEYKALRDDEVIRQIRAGEIDINFKGSKYAVYDNETAKGMGVDLTLKKNNFTFKAFGSITRGVVETEYFRGNSSPGSIKLSEYQFIKRVYYQIEPFIRYDNTISPPYPANYVLKPVNINPFGFEIYMDDLNSTNNYNTVQLSLDKGYYKKLQAGVDYKINYTTGLITFIRNIPANVRIFAVYNLAGTTSTDPYALQPSDANHPRGIFDGKTFVFIKYGYSIEETIGNDVNNDGKVNQDVYEVRSFYYIGDKHLLQDNFMLSFFLENGIMTRTDIKSLGKYTIDYTNGIIQFRYREPFKEVLQAKNLDDEIYNENQPQNVFEYSLYRISVDYYREARSFKLKHLNILPKSVRVKVNGRVLNETLYTVDYTTGYIMFSDPNNPLIGPETNIEIRYEYLPFESQSREFAGGFRAEYKFSRDLKVGGSLLYSRSSGDENIPMINEEPSQTIFFEGDTTLNIDGKRLAQFVNLFRKKKITEVPLQLKGYVEYAQSYKNVNTFGKALIDNIESSEEFVSLSLSDKDWVLSSPPGGVTTRDVLNYYYYRDLVNPDSLKNLLYPALKLDYSTKAGPYNVAAGHVVDVVVSQDSQMSLVLDFDGSGDFVSIATRKLKDQVLDLSAIQYVEISYLYEGSGNADLHFEVGSINEDSDGDGVLDTEDINNNGILDIDLVSGFTEDLGYLFNETGHPTTRIGNGANINNLLRGNGVLNTEDINSNGILDTGENVYSFSGQSLTLDSADQTWKKERIYIDHSTVTQADINLLKQVETIRLYLQKGNTVSGRLYIDSIRFVSSKWREVQLNGSLTSPDRLKVSVINTHDDNEYSLESFMFAMRDVYKSLYGVQSNQDLIKEREAALKLEYSIPSANSNVSVTRRFMKPIDIRNYKTLTLWMNYRNFSSDHSVGLIIGSSETDYVEFKIPMDFGRIWREVRLRLKKSSGGEVFVNSVSGVPDLKRMTYMKVVIYSSSSPATGEIWVNDIYLTEPETLTDSAHWYEGEINITKPLFKTKSGIPILSNISLSYVQKGHGSNFNTIGKPNNDISEEYKQFFSSFKILPNWSTTVDFVREDSDTDSLNEDVLETKRGKTRTDSVFFVTDYRSTINGLPSIKIAYKFDQYNNRLYERISDGVFRKERKKFSHVPVISIREKIDKFLWGNLLARFSMNMSFKKDEIRRDSGQVDIVNAASSISMLETEKRQRADALLNIEYFHKYFYLKPEIGASSEEVVQLFGKNQLNNDDLISFVNGDFHFPFLYNKDLRFVERKKLLNITAGLNDFSYIAPSYKMSIQYFENKFGDYEFHEVPLYLFKRFKNSSTLLSTDLSIPIILRKIKKLKSINNFNIFYSRSLFLSEENVPFEGEKKDNFDERYGITRSVSALSNAGLNIFSYYPFYFFLGGKNFANGRDFIKNKLNKQITFSNLEIVSEYNNQLRLIENFSVNSAVDYKKFNMNFNAGLNQVCDRLNINGVPSQVATATAAININLNLMKLFNFGFFRTNKKGLPYHSAYLSLGYKFDNNMLITSNIEETSHSPSFGLTFKWDRSSVGVKFSMDLKKKNKKTYISFNPFSRGGRDYIYIENMPYTLFYKQKDISYNFSAIYETDVKWIYKVFSLFYKLIAFPIFKLEYTMKINKYDYTFEASPEPYDLHMFSTKLTLDLHKNIQGGLSARFAFEQFRNREYNDNVNKELFSFEIGLNFTLLF